MRLKIKNRSHRYDIYRPRPGHGHKYTKYKMIPPPPSPHGSYNQRIKSIGLQIFASTGCINYYE